MNYRNTRCYLNCEKAIFEGVGKYQIPEIQPIDLDIENVPLLGFNYAKTERHPEDKIVHFYLDDYQFDRVWNNPDIYLSVLSRFKAVLSPDFSTYSDFPNAISIFNHYRKQWCGAYWQMHGINVIPTIGWGNEDTWEYVLDGIPRNALICISTVGMFSRKEYRRRFAEGYQKAIEALQPKKILFYGKMFPEITIPDGVEYSVAINQNTLNRKLARERMNAEAEKNQL